MVLINKIEFKNGAYEDQHIIFKPFLWTFNSYPQSLWSGRVEIGRISLTLMKTSLWMQSGKHLRYSSWPCQFQKMSASSVTLKWTTTKELAEAQQSQPLSSMVGTVQVNTWAKAAWFDDHLPRIRHFDGLKVCIAGGLDHSRVAKSNMQILKRLGSNPTLQVQTNGEVRIWNYGTFVTIDEVIEEVDVVMCSVNNTNVMITNHSSLKKTTTVFMAWHKNAKIVRKETAILVRPAANRQMWRLLTTW